MAFLLDVAVSIGTDIAKWLIVPVGRQLGYALFYKKKIQALKEEVDKLHDVLLDLEYRRDAAQRNGELVTENVSKWLLEAKDAEENATVLLNGWEIAKNRCCRGWIPNPKTRYVVGRQATKSKLKMEELIQVGGQFDVISHTDLPEGVAGAQAGLPHVFDSRALLLKEILNSLSDLDIGVVGVYGPGGVGKSTLMKQVMQRVKEEKLFDEVAMATVSANPDVKAIQGVISEMLGLKFNLETIHGRGYQLKKRLENSHEQKKQVLIILDDLWKELDLEEVGIPCNHKGVKLLFTSRDKDVLSGKMGCQHNFEVEGLRYAESWNLFREIVGETADDPKVNSIAKEVVQKCVGLPVLLKAIASVLKNGNYSRWEDALERLRCSKDVYSSLELSYKNLDEELKTLFLTCSLMGMANISVNRLLNYTVGLGLFEGVPTMKRARDTLKDMIRSLQASSLLLEDKEDGDQVKMHDIVREVAVTIASRDRNIAVLNNDYRLEKLSEEKINQIGVISLPGIDIPGLPEGLQCPELKMFIFYAKGYHAEIPDSFFQGMRKLKVLDFTNLRFDSLPSSIQVLHNLTTLCVEQCKVGDVGIIGSLKRLQILSFVGSKITLLSKEIGNLCELRMLDLSDCSELKKIDPGVLKSLPRLEELKMKNSFSDWENEVATEQSNARLSELNSMPELRCLEVHIPNATLLSADMSFGNLLNYRILVGDTRDWFSDNKESRMLKFKLDSRKGLMEGWVQNTLANTHELVLGGLGGIKKSIHELSIQGFRELKHLRVQNSPIVQYVVRSTGYLPCYAFPMLESLVLEDLVNLEKICRGHVEQDCFSKLKVVKVMRCGKLKNLFNHSLMQRFSHLEVLEISDCKIFQGIIDTDVGVEGESNENATVELPQLRRLMLHGLPELRSLFGCMEGNSSLASVRNSEITSLASDAISRGRVSLPRLEDMELYDLPRWTEIWCGLGGQSSLEMENLKSLQVKYCGKLASILDSSLVSQLRNLESLIVTDCKGVEYVFEVNGSNAFLPRLQKMELWRLPNLRCIWRGNGDSNMELLLRNLKLLRIAKCKRLRYMLPLSAAKVFNQLKELYINDCDGMEQIIETKEEGEEKEKMTTLETLFPSLSALSLREMSHLKAFAVGSSYSISLPKLKALKIEQCPQMEAFIMQPRKQHHKNRSKAGDGEEVQTPNASDVAFFSQKVLLPSLEVLNLSSLNSMNDIWPNQDLTSESSSSSCSSSSGSFQQLKFLVVEQCNNLTSIFPLSSTSDMNLMGSNLKRIDIGSCDSVEVIFESTQVGMEISPPGRVIMLNRLEELKLEDLPKLKRLSRTTKSHAVLLLPSLRKIDVTCCDSLTHLLAVDTARHLTKLSSLDLYDCKNMLKVIDDEDTRGVVVPETESTAEPISFPCLATLQLGGLESLVSFSSGSSSCAFDFPSLVELIIDDCGSFNTFIKRPKAQALSLFDDKTEFPILEKMLLSNLGSLRRLWDDDIPLGSFSKLKSLKACKCGNLEYLFPASVARDLLQLQEIDISDCVAVEEIIWTRRQVSEQQDDDDETCPTPEDDHQLLFPQLTSLRFKNLQNLKRLFPSKFSLGERVIIEGDRHV